MNDIIKMTMGELSITLEVEVMKAVQKVGIDVDKDKLLEALQLADTIVRCKDCKWFGDIGCAIQIVDDSDKPAENDYCSFAEVRDE